MFKFIRKINKNGVFYIVIIVFVIGILLIVWLGLFIILF